MIYFKRIWFSMMLPLVFISALPIVFIVIQKQIWTGEADSDNLNPFAGLLLFAQTMLK